MNGIPHTRYHSKLLICLCLLGAIFVAYGQVINFDFVGFDDELYVSGNRHIKNGLNVENIVWAFSFHGFSYWQPLTWLSHMLDCQLFGLMSGWHHLSNLIFHILNTLLLFFIFSKMTGALWRSAFVAALFALHPLNVESVAWVAERKNVLSTFFWMLTLLAYTKYVERPKIDRYLIVVVVFVLGLMAKPMVSVLPFVFLLIDYWPLGRMQLGRSENYDLEAVSTVKSGYQRPVVLRLVLEKTPFFALSAVSIYLSTLSVQNLGIIVSTGAVPMTARIANALFSYIRYLEKIIWPQKLAVFYPYPNSLPLWQASVSGLLLVGISAAVYLKVRRHPYLAVGWLWYLVTLLPVSGLMQAGLWPAMADRFAYVPSIGLFILISWGLPAALSKRRNRNLVLSVLTGAVLFYFLICTALQTSHWKDEIALFQHALKVTDNNWPAHNNLGVAFSERGKFDKAAFQFKEVLKIKPDHVGSRNNLANILFDHGKLKEAALQLKEAVRIKPNDTDMYNNLAIVLASQGKFDESVSFFEKALVIKPENDSAHYNFGTLLASQGKLQEAGKHFAEAIKIKPDYAAAYYQIGIILNRQGKAKIADIFFAKAIQLNPVYAKNKKQMKIINQPQDLKKKDAPM